jgi:hypothetical protein
MAPLAASTAAGRRMIDGDTLYCSRVDKASNAIKAGLLYYGAYRKIVNCLHGPAWKPPEPLWAFYACGGRERFFIDRLAGKEYLEAAKHEFANHSPDKERSDAHSVLGYAGLIGEAGTDHRTLRR